MKQYKFYQKGYHGISCYSCCNTCYNFQHEQQQELTKRTSNSGVLNQQ